MDEYMELVRELENSKYTGIEFAWDMPFRDFIQWVLNQPFYAIFIVVFLIICLNILFKFLYNDLTKK